VSQEVRLEPFWKKRSAAFFAVAREPDAGFDGMNFHKKLALSVPRFVFRSSHRWRY